MYKYEENLRSKGTSSKRTKSKRASQQEWYHHFQWSCSVGIRPFALDTEDADLSTASANREPASESSEIATVRIDMQSFEF